MTFGQRFKQLRLKKGLKQQELIDDFNKQYGYDFTRSIVSYYENDKKRPATEVLKDFALYFNISVDYLLGIENLVNSPDSSYEISLEDEFMNAATIFFKHKDITREEKDEMFKTLSKLYFNSLRK